MRVEHIGDATLYLGDSQTWLNELPACFRVDCLVTDPPYGVDFIGKVTKHTKANGGYEQGDNGLGPVIVERCLNVVDRALVFSGARLLHSYPQPYEIGFVYTPSGAGRGRWGFTMGHPILYYYGKALEHGRRSPNGFESFALAGEERHPCPKPVKWMEWAVAKASNCDDSVLDPFMGSGTTGVACANLGRKFIGIEIEEKYFDIACERIDMAYSQGRLFA